MTLDLIPVTVYYLNHEISFNSFCTSFKGGSCGVMAAIQATVLQTLLFKDGRIPLNRL